MTRTLCEHMQSLFPDIAPDSDHIGSGQNSGEQRHVNVSPSRPMVSAQQAFTRRLAKYLLDEKLGQSVELGSEIDLVGVTHDATPSLPHKEEQHDIHSHFATRTKRNSREIRFRDAFQPARYAVEIRSASLTDHPTIPQDQHSPINERGERQSKQQISHHG